MWLFTNFGFFSVVQKPDMDVLTIRARVHADLDHLRAKYLPQLSATLGKGGTDYPWRATVTHDDFAAALGKIVQDVTYANFKSEVASRQGKARAARYGKVWSALYDMPDDQPFDSHSSLPDDATAGIESDPDKDMALQGNYLGSPDVVSQLVSGFLANMEVLANAVRAGAPVDDIGAELAAHIHRMADIFSGREDGYSIIKGYNDFSLGMKLRADLGPHWAAHREKWHDDPVAVLFDWLSALFFEKWKIAAGDDILLEVMLGPSVQYTVKVLLGIEERVGQTEVLPPLCQSKPTIIEDCDEEDCFVPVDPHVHPHLNARGEVVRIKHPHSPTPPESFDDENAIVTFVPGGDCPSEINGIDFNSWDDHPDGEGWEDVEGQLDDLEEPPLHLKHGLKPASGCVIEETDGRVWLVSPTDQYGGYINSFPKGQAEGDEISWQANAIKEAYEESGLQVRIIGLIGDVVRSTTVTRYYRAVRVGGMPTDMGWESQAVHLVPIRKLPELLNSPYDHQVLALAYGLLNH